MSGLVTTIERAARECRPARRLLPLLAATLLGSAFPALAALPVTTSGTRFQLVASAGYVYTPDGASIYSWGYGLLGEAMQYPGPLLVVDEGADITVELTNALPPSAGNVSIVFPGQSVVATGGVAGLLTNEAPPCVDPSGSCSGTTVTYTFRADKPGTYLYHSGTRPDLQVEMGLQGAIVVRPTLIPLPSGQAGCAYDRADTCFDREYLFFLSEVDLEVHRAVEQQAALPFDPQVDPDPIKVSTEPYDPEYWFLNGRCAPDTMGLPGRSLLPNQPYNVVPRMHPGERLLMRVVGGGRQMHPFHHHGNHAKVLARDGNLILHTEGGSTSLGGPEVFTIPSLPGSTADAIFEWTGEGLGWDAYGVPHVGGAQDPNDPSGLRQVCDTPQGFDSVTHEWCPDHGKKIPVQLPSQNVLTFGGFWGGSPYLGYLGTLPPEEGGLNPDAGYTFMWHSHTEREIVNNDVFPGGMMTMLIVEAPSTQIAE